MFQKRSLTTGFLVASLGLAAGLAVLSSPVVASAGDDCSSLKKAAVQGVCKEKGKKGVEAAMKDAVKAAKKAGAKMECKDCHDDKKDNALKDNAAGDFDKNLAQYFGK
jgi:hypothetical protein